MKRFRSERTAQAKAYSWERASILGSYEPLDITDKVQCPKVMERDPDYASLHGQVGPADTHKR